jgi:assimilatory nitrate reductase electron transfer subunit
VPEPIPHQGAEPAERVVVVGFGMAGGRLVDEILAREADGRARRRTALTVIGAEPYGAYNRVLLSEVVAGRADVAALALADPAVHAGRGVDVRLAEHATAIELPVDPSSPGRLVTSSGDRVEFTKLVMATGASPVVPTLSGINDTGALPPGVHCLRTVDDAREIVAGAANARRAVVLGGGLLGLEAARGLARRGLDVTVLHGARHLLEGRLDAAAAAVLTRSLRRLGVPARTGVRAQGVVVRRDGDGPVRLVGVRLDSGEVVRADLLVIACGVRARTELAADVGLDIGLGVIVDDRLTTSDPRVLAIGDCAEHDGGPAGLVAPAWDQARVVADLLSGADPHARYRGHRPSVRLKAADIEVAAVGDTAADPWDEVDGLEVVQLLDAGRGRYVKAVVRDGVVVGGVVVGDARAAAELTLLVERGSAAPTDRSLLVLPGSQRAADQGGDPTHIPDRATVCRCNGVTKGAIVRAWSAGARTPDAVAARTHATTGCGSCRDTVAGIVGWLAASDPDPDDSPVTRDQPVGDRTSTTHELAPGGHR